MMGARLTTAARLRLGIDTPPLFIEQSERANETGSWGGLLRAGGVMAIGAAGVVLGAIPLWAARRILYPITTEPLHYAPETVVDLPVVPERVEIEARDGKKLGGWFVPAPDATQRPAPCVVLVYGYGGYKEQMHGYAKMLYEGGFATLMFDMRGSGLRRGEPVTLGFKERWDLQDAVLYARSREDVDGERIGVLGVSMGGATALMAAEDDPHIKAIVADSAFADIHDMIKPGLAAFVGPRATWLSRLIIFYAEAIMGVKSDDLRPVLAIERMGERPLLIIHGENDTLTTPESAHKLYQAARGPKELWMVPGCGHGAAPVVVEAEYKRRVREFFNRYL